MSRSLFTRLHRRFGPSIDRREHARRVAAHRARLSRYLPLDFLAPNFRPPNHQPLNVAVIGGGFAGLAAADLLQRLRMNVTLFDARESLGGRVRTTTFIPNRILEAGAELIGRNHPVWIDYARQFGLGLSVITDDDEYTGARLSPQVRLGRRLFTAGDADRLHHLMQDALRDLTNRAIQVLPGDTWVRPWDVPSAEVRDGENLQTWITDYTNTVRASPQWRAILRSALEFEFENHMTVHPSRQSLLGVMTQIAGGGGWLHWEDQEVYRCEDGNQALANRLASRLRERSPQAEIHRNRRVNKIDFVDRGLEIGSESSVASGRPQTQRFDYAILAVPPSVWSGIRMNLVNPIRPIQLGPAVKYLAEVENRYWITSGHAPSGADDELGQLWEGTDNQMGASGIDLSIFAGGARRASRQEADFPAAIGRLLPGFHLGGEHEYADWPHIPHILTGYSCPAPGQVTTILRDMQRPIHGRLFLAGEHVSPAFFGYMEGALQSGLVMVVALLAQAGILTSSP